MSGCCSRPSASEMATMTEEQVFKMLNLNYVAITVFVVIQGIFFVLWQMAAGIPGFALYDGDPGAGAFSNYMWWSAIDFIAFGVGCAAPLFRLNYVGEGGTVEKNVEWTRAWLVAYMFILVVAGISNLIHAGLLISDGISCTSTLCRQNSWALWVAVALFAILGIYEWVQISFVRIYKSNLVHALGKGKMESMQWKANSRRK